MRWRRDWPSRQLRLRRGWLGSLLRSLTRGLVGDLAATPKPLVLRLAQDDMLLWRPIREPDGSTIATIATIDDARIRQPEG